VAVGNRTDEVAAVVTDDGIAQIKWVIVGSEQIEIATS